ncbi:MAG: alkaline serine protease, partial [Dehalococcoidales bacterium]|nr:alkaline serine protease [Dehalococcoidales bacterium]
MAAGEVAQYVPDEVLVQFNDNWPQWVRDRYVSRKDATVSEEIDALDLTVLKVPCGDVEEIVAYFNSLSLVEYAEPNYLRYASETPNDTDWANQYGKVRMQAPDAWDITTGSTGVTIAIIDTGVDLDHPDLSSKIVSGYDFANNDSSADDDHGHGTHVAGIAAAVSNNSAGIAGVSWGARIMPIKVLNAAGGGTISNEALGIRWAVDQGADIINLSLGGQGTNSTEESAINYALNAGVMVVAAAGNCGDGWYFLNGCSSQNPSNLFPASFDGVFAVGATDTNNNRASFSSYQSWVDIAAPGDDIYSTYAGGGYATEGGTSQAAPQAAGAAALLWDYSAAFDTAAEV